jgi:hypothetical protein
MFLWPCASTASLAGARVLGATLLGVPVYGTAPLTVDVYVGIGNLKGSLVYRWNFGGGALSLLPVGVYMMHLYRHPVLAQSDYCAKTLDNLFHDDSRPTASALGKHHIGSRGLRRFAALPC